MILTCTRCGIRREVNESRAGADRCVDCCRIPAPPADTLTPHQRGVLARLSLNRATEFACMVRDQGPDTTGAYLDRLTRQDLYGLVVTLAAMVDIDRPTDELIGWITWTEKEVAA